MKRAAKIILFFLILILTLGIASRVLTDKYQSSFTGVRNGFYAEEKDSVDLLVLGSSNAFCTIDPVVLYEEYGIRAYDFCSSSQPMDMTYLYLKEALKTQSPKVVALEVNSMIGDLINSDNDDARVWGYTGLPLSVNKLKAIYDDIGAIDDEFMSYAFPMLMYHTRWKDVAKTDYVYADVDRIDENKGYRYYEYSVEEALNLSNYMDYDDSEAWISEDNIAYLDKIATLCNKNDIKLVLFKSPMQDWYSYETKAVQSLASERGLEYIDYNEINYETPEVLALDPLLDFCDTEHLNNSGAKKVTMHFGEFLQENYALEDTSDSDKSSSWDLALDIRQRRENKPYTSAATAEECWNILKEYEGYTVILTRRNVKPIEQWVYCNSKLELHNTWEDDDTLHLVLEDRSIVLSKDGSNYHVLVDDVEYIQPAVGWNIVVIDNITGDIESLSFNE